MPADVLSPEAIATAGQNEPVPGASKFMQSITTNIASIGQPPAAPVVPAQPAATPDQAKPATPAPASGATPAPDTTKPGEPAKPAAVTAAEPDDDSDLPKNITGAKAEHWDRLLARLEKHKVRAGTFSEQLKAKDDEIVKLKSKPTVDPEFQSKFDAIQKERDTYAEIVQRNDIANDPKFKAHYEPKLTVAMEAAKAIVGEKGDQLAALLSAPAGKWRTAALKELAGDLDPFDTSQLGTAIARYDEVRAERDSLIADSKNQAEKRRLAEAQEQAEHQKRVASVREATYQEALSKARAFDAFKTIEGNAEHNAAVAARRQR